MATPQHDPAHHDEQDQSPARFRDLLGDRVFGPFFFSNALSNTGNWFQNVAAGIVVFDLTGSNTAVGAVSILQFATTMLLAPWAGGLTDRVNRQRMLLAGQAVALAGAAFLAVYVLSVGIDDLSSPWPVYLATAIIGLGIGFILPSLQAVVPALVRRRDLDAAITLNSMTFNVARGVGPVLAGATVAAFGAGVAFGVNALSFVPLLVVLAVISPRGPVAPPPEADGGTVGETVAWIRARPAVVALLVATLAVGWTSDPFSTLMPAYAKAELGRGDETVGFLVGAFGAGAAVLAPFSGRIRGVVGRGRVIAVGLGIVAAGLAVMAAAASLATALAGAAISGGGFLLGVTSTNTELQRGIPEDRRGRIMAFWSVAFLGCRPVAAVTHGRIADLLGVRVAIVVVALVAGVGGAWIWRQRPTGDDVARDGGTDSDVRPTSHVDIA